MAAIVVMSMSACAAQSAKGSAGQPDTTTSTSTDGSSIAETVDAPTEQTVGRGRPSTQNTQPTTTEPTRGELVIHGVGDVNLDPAYIPNLANQGYGFAFEGLDGLFENDDLTVVNLECVPSDLGRPLDKAFTFRCDPDALAVARANGVDAANLANNHSLDFGVEAMLDGLANVEAAGIAAVGVGHDRQRATAPAVFETNGWTIAVLGMNGVVSAEWWLADDDRPGTASGDDLEQMVAAVEAAGEAADIVVVSIHWLWELETTPRPDDEERARAMIAAGADIVFGHHPHRLGDVDFIDGRPVFWTLGNFVWPRFSDAGATTAVGRVVIGPDGAIEACLIPAFIATSGRPELTGPPSCHGEPT